MKAAQLRRARLKFARAMREAKTETDAILISSLYMTRLRRKLSERNIVHAKPAR